MSKKHYYFGRYPALLVLIYMLFVVGCGGSLEQQNANAKEALKLAQIHYQKDSSPKKESHIPLEIRQNAEKAFLEYSEIVKNSPRSEYVPQALFKMAEIRNTFGPAKEAIPYWMRLIYDYPDSQYSSKADEEINQVVKKWMAAANNHVYRERYLEAIYLFKQVLKINPYNAEAHFDLGKAYVESQRYDEAILEYQTAVAIDPNFLEAQYMLGLIYLAKNQPNDALAQFQQVIEINPDLAAAYYNIALTYEEILQDKKKARDNWEIYLKKAQGQEKENKWVPTANHHLESL